MFRKFLFLKKSPSQLFFSHDESPLNINIIRKRNIKRNHFVPEVVCLRDARSTRFTNSVHSMINSNLANGPVYFNCFPNFSMNINDPSILSSLTLNIKTKNMNFVEEAQTIATIYRIYYKVMTTQLNSRAICQSVKDETLLLQYNPNNIQAFVPKN